MNQVFWLYLDKHLAMVFGGYRITVCLILQETVKLFSKVVAALCKPASSGWESRLPGILTSTPFMRIIAESKFQSFISSVICEYFFPIEACDFTVFKVAFEKQNSPFITFYGLRFWCRH